jgi:hypothetical protein
LNIAVAVVFAAGVFFALLAIALGALALSDLEADYIGPDRDNVPTMDVAFACAVVAVAALFVGGRLNRRRQRGQLQT